MKILLILMIFIGLYLYLQPGSLQPPSSASAEPLKYSNQQDKWKADTALYLYKTLENYNFDHAAKSYVTDPDAVLALKDGWRLVADSYRVKAINDLGVVMGFTRFCYPEIDVQIYMQQRGQRYYVEFERTLREQAHQHSNTKPLHQYCYEFKEQPLEGIIMSSPWLADRVETRIIDFGSRKELGVDIVSARCDDYPFCITHHDQGGSGMTIGISSLDFSGSGGNLGGRQYISISSPDHTTVNRHEGSYKITQLKNGMVRLHLAIPEFESTELNGYIDFILPAVH